MTQTIVWLSLYTISYEHDLLLNVISLQVESTLIVTICLAVIIQNKYEEIKKTAEEVKAFARRFSIPGV
jgi:hypothetical protein